MQPSPPLAGPVVNEVKQGADGYERECQMLMLNRSSAFTGHLRLEAERLCAICRVHASHTIRCLPALTWLLMGC